METDIQKLALDICAKTVGFNIEPVEPKPEEERIKMEPVIVTKEQIEKMKSWKRLSEPYTLTHEEREVVKEVLNVPDKYLDRCEIHLFEDGDINIKSPKYTWMTLCGREWKINIKDKTCELVSMN